MSATKQMIRVIPDRFIEFPLSLFTTLRAKLRLENLLASPSHVAFKIKTTAPKRYLVRPSTGIISPDGFQDVEIVLQPLSENPASGQDRFLIQAALLENPDQQLPRDYWQNVDKSMLQEQRLSVTFREPEATMNDNADMQSGYTKSDPNYVTATQAGMPSTGMGNSSRTESNMEYQQLVEYSMKLEKRNRELTKEIEALNKANDMKANDSAPNSRTMGLEFWHWFLIALFMLVFLKITDRI